MMFLRGIAQSMRIGTEIVDDSRFELEPDTPTGKLVQLCELVGADRYVTGPAGLGYLEVDRFRDRDIHLDVIEYSHYPEYAQTTAPFQHGASVLDLIASVGDDATSHLVGRFHCVTDEQDPPS